MSFLYCAPERCCFCPPPAPRCLIITGNPSPLPVSSERTWREACKPQRLNRTRGLRRTRKFTILALARLDSFWGYLCYNHHRLPPPRSHRLTHARHQLRTHSESSTRTRNQLTLCTTTHQKRGRRNNTRDFSNQGGEAGGSTLNIKETVPSRDNCPNRTTELKTGVRTVPQREPA